jgi:two-component sensor histidine kinase
MDTILALENAIGPRKEAIAEANHRIANSLTLLVSMVRLQAAAAGKLEHPPSKAEIRLMLEGIAARINTIAQLHRLLSHVPADGVTSLKPHLRHVTDALVAALSSPEQKVAVSHSGEDCLVPVRHVQPIILILCEVFINAMKYAHPAGVPLQMAVDCDPAANGWLVLTVSDDGVGLPVGFDPRNSRGLGFRVMRSLAAEIGASLDIESGALGLTFRLSLPASTTVNARLA